MARKPEPFPGIWGPLVEKFTPLGLGAILRCPVATVEAMARGRVPVIPTTADTLSDLCRAHGIRPILCWYADWKHKNGVVIACTHEGWIAWHLDNSYPRHSRWTGTPEDLEPVDEATLQQARTKLWPW